MSTDRATCWSVTINNPTPQDEEYIALARQKGWKVSGQLEKGAQGTPHYQLCVKTPQVRFSQVKKAFPRGHIEIARNHAALELYVEKSETAVAPLPVQNEFYPSLSKLWKLIWDVVEDPKNACSEFTIGRSGRFNSPINALNKACSILITRGYYVEQLASNPLVIAQWKQFHDAIRIRLSLPSPVDRQTDRQEEIISQSVFIPTTDGLSSQASIQEEADASPRSQIEHEGSSETE